MTTTQPPVTTTNTDIVLDALSDRQWRVLDARVPNESPAVIMGFICFVMGIYEATTVSRPLDVAFCSDLAAAQLAVLDRC